MVNRIVGFMWTIAWTIRDRLSRWTTIKKAAALWWLAIFSIILIAIPWKAIGIIVIVIGFVGFIVISVCALFSLLDP